MLVLLKKRSSRKMCEVLPCDIAVSSFFVFFVFILYNASRGGNFLLLFTLCLSLHFMRRLMMLDRCFFCVFLG